MTADFGGPNAAILNSGGRRVTICFRQPLAKLLEPACLDLNPDLPVISYETTGKLLHLSVPLFPHL